MSSTLCRDCFNLFSAENGEKSCAACGKNRLILHDELTELPIAHLDCDAFFANIEKRDNPALKDLPVIVGGGRRGVVSTCCYIARTYGVRSAMPMFKALQLCPNAVVIAPNGKKYSEASRQIRDIMNSATPLVEPVSIDEAYLDLSGTQRLHGGPPAQVLAKLVQRIEQEVRITVSIGLSYNKFLAKIASDQDKPRGFFVIGKNDALAFLASQPVSVIPGVGPRMVTRLLRHGIETIRDLRAQPYVWLADKFGSHGQYLYDRARGIDERQLGKRHTTKSLSSETTFDHDSADSGFLKDRLWVICEKLSMRLRKEGFSAQSVTLKLKSPDFKSKTVARQLNSPTLLSQRLYEAAVLLLEKQPKGKFYRLIGVAAGDLHPADAADPPDLAWPELETLKRREQTLADIREKMGKNAILSARTLSTAQ